MVSKEVRGNSLTAEICKIIRGRILSGEYKIGEKLKEKVIAEELRVSRTPIREAFKRLQEEGLVDYIPNRGCYAKGFTKRDIEDIYAVRKALELLCIEWAIDRIEMQHIMQLEEYCDLMDFCQKQQDFKSFKNLNKSFHDIIYEAAGSRFMAQVLRSYKEYIDQTRRVIYYDNTYLSTISAEHRVILRAIIDRDVEAGKEAMAKHIDGSKKRAEEVYKL